MIVSIHYFDIRYSENTLDEIIESFFQDKETRLFIPELEKNYTYNPESIAMLKEDVNAFFCGLQKTAIDKKELNEESKNSKDRISERIKPIGKLEEAVKTTDSRASLLTGLMCIGGFLCIIVGLVTIGKDPAAGGMCIGSAIGAFMLASFFSSISSCITELHNTIKKLEKELSDIRKTNQ